MVALASASLESALQLLLPGQLLRTAWLLEYLELATVLRSFSLPGEESCKDYLPDQARYNDLPKI